MCSKEINIFVICMYRMFKVFYNLPNDITDRTIGNIGILDILQTGKCHVYPEQSQVRGEKIDIAYIMYDERLLLQLSEQNIKKISIFSKGDDDIVIPKNFVKYSSELVTSMNGKYYNVILNNRTYKTDNEILIVGDENVYQDVLRNIYSLFGNVIMCITNKYKAEIDAHIASRHLPNSGGIYYTVYSALEGLKKCTIKKNVIKVRSDEHFSDFSPIITYMQTDDKIVITNASIKKVAERKFSIGDHIIAGKYEQISKMYSSAMNILNNKVNDMRKKLRIEYTPEQILVVGYLQDKLDFIGAKNEKYVRELMIDNFHVVQIDELGNYMIPCGDKKLQSGKQLDKELYSTVCQIKTIEDI